MYRIAFIVSLVIMSSQTAVGLSGSGTEAEPWRIESPADFKEFSADANYWAGYTRLETDVNLAVLTYTTAVIALDVNNANDEFDGTAFTGVFDGNDKRIINLVIDDGGVGNDYLGLFGYIYIGEVKNLGLEGCFVSGEYYVGGVVGLVEDGSVSKCYSSGSVSGYWHVGGLVGENRDIVSNCYSTCDVNGAGDVGGLVGINSYSSVLNSYYKGDVSGVGYVGGLVGHNWRSSVLNCYSTGSITSELSVGGLIGYNQYGYVSNCHSTGYVTGTRGTGGGLVGQSSYSSILNSYSTCDVNSVRHVGGLVGHNFDTTITNCCSIGSVSGTGDSVGGLLGNSWNGSVSNCYSIGEVSGHDQVGGLVGYANSDISNCYSASDVGGAESFVGGLVGKNYEIVSNCFWDIDTQTHGVTKSFGIDWGTVINVAGLYTEQMQTKSTFTDAGWDFVDIWDLTCEGMNYPRFIWRIPPADFLCPHGVDFRDYSFFAGYWGDTNCELANDCDGRDFDLSGTVDIGDFDIFCDYWLNGAGG